MGTFWNIVKTILVLPFCILGAICFIPFMALYCLISIPYEIIEGIWLDSPEGLDKELY